MRYRLLLFLLITSSSAWSQFNAFNYESNKIDTGKHGAVVSAHPLASKVGRDVLRKGGNAFDAAIAIQWTLAVVYPGAGNIGGGGFLVAVSGKKQAIALDFREVAPLAATQNMYLDEAGNADTEKSRNGHLSCGVPGTVAGLFATHRYAKLPMRDLIQPAIALAEKGFAITAAEAASLNESQRAFETYNTAPTAFLRQQPWKKGDTLIQTDLAETLKRIKSQGLKGFYEGKTAALIVAEMQRGRGLITLRDLKHYRAKFRTPHQFAYKGHTIISMPMPSSGGLLLHQMLKMITPYSIENMGFQTPASVQLMVEAERRAYADRARYMGDADFYNVPVTRLASDAYLKERMQDYIPGKAGNSSQTVEGRLPGYESEETTHLSVIDHMGNMVSVTTTLNNHYGSKTVVGGAGFLLNDEMDDFSAKPGAPNMFGAVGGQANAIAPGKRMLSSMTPAIILKRHKPFLVAGTPGGTTIPTSVFQTIVNIIDFNMTTYDAVNKPKFHHQWLPDEVFTEDGFPASTAAALTGMGYQLRRREQIGRTEVIKVLPNGSFEAVADHRGDDSAEVW